jgi:hypothetical protein
VPASFGFAGTSAGVPIPGQSAIELEQAASAQAVASSIAKESFLFGPISIPVGGPRAVNSAAMAFFDSPVAPTQTFVV